jgi:hypothetical protein
MIFRAIFWVGLVALLMPHEPDLGFGRPASIDSDVTGQVSDWTKVNVQTNLAHPTGLCRYNPYDCAKGVTLLDNFKSAATRSLADVRADIEQNGQAHQNTGS